MGVTKPSPGGEARISHAASRKLVQHEGSLGVDFGASQLRIAMAAEPEPKLLPFFDARTALASICTVTETGAIVAGREAAELRVLSPERTIHAAKCLIGRAYDTASLHQLASHFGFELTQTDDHRFGARLGTGKSARVVPMHDVAVALLLEMKHARLGGVTFDERIASRSCSTRSASSTAGARR